MNNGANLSTSEKEKNIEKIVFETKKYMENTVPKRTPIFNIILEQIKYISPIMWFIQLVIVLGIILILNLRIYNLENFRKILYFISPFLSIMTVPEIIKNYFFEIYEIESTCKNSNAKVFIIRLIIVGFSNIICLLILTGIVAINMKFEILELITYMFLPFNFSNIMILFLVNTFRIKSHYMCVICSVMSVILIMLIIPKTILQNINNFISILLLSLTIIILSIQIFSMLKVIYRKEKTNYEFNFE